jgi:hypothetical protein
VIAPRHLSERGLRLWTGRVQHQHVDWTKGVGHRRDETGDLPLVGDVAGERVGHPTVVADGADDIECESPTVHVIDRHSQTIAQGVSQSRCGAYGSSP